MSPKSPSAWLISVWISFNNSRRSLSCRSNSSIIISRDWCSLNLLHSCNIRNILCVISSRRFLFSAGLFTSSFTKLTNPWTTSRFSLVRKQRCNKAKYIGTPFHCLESISLFEVKTYLFTSSRITVGSSQWSKGSTTSGSYNPGKWSVGRNHRQHCKSTFHILRGMPILTSTISPKTATTSPSSVDSPAVGTPPRIASVASALSPANRNRSDSARARAALAADCLVPRSSASCSPMKIAKGIKQRWIY